MKIIAKREAILSPLQAVIGVVERRQTMPILANVLLSAKGGRLAVTATDLEVELVATSEVDVQRNGEVTVPGRKLLDICRALPEGVEMTKTSPLATSTSAHESRISRWLSARSIQVAPASPAEPPAMP